MRCLPAWLLLATLGGYLQTLSGADRKLTEEERIDVIRGLTAEYATAKTPLPRSKKPLVLESNGTFDEKGWAAIGRERGPAARVGDLLKITKVTPSGGRIVFELNGGAGSGRKWYERIQIDSGVRTVPLGGNSGSVAPGGTTLALVLPDQIPAVTAAEVKKLLAPVLDFNQRSAAEQYVETLPAPIQKAIKDKKAVVGMDRDQVVLAMGRPDNKIRETVDGAEQEDWIYGKPPGRIVFVTFEGDKVVQIKDAYANIGGSVAPPLPSPR